MKKKPTLSSNPLPAKNAPEWLASGIVYQIWLRGFTPEGTLAAATQRLAEVAELGATIVYLSALMLADDDSRRTYWSARQRASQACNPRNPYRAKDYDVVDPEYGTEADLCRFVATAHRFGIRVLMDMVFAHTGPTSTLTANPEFHQRDENGNLKTAHWRFPLLNFQSAELRRYLIQNMCRWLAECDVDGFRCDIADTIPLDFWEEARPKLETVRPDVAMIAESHDTPMELVHAFDASYGFNWYRSLLKTFTRGGPASEVQELWEREKASFPVGAKFLRYTDNHDLNRADVVFGESGCRAATTLNFLMDGVPMLFNGQEIGDATPQDLFSHWPIRWEAANLPQAVAKRRWYHQLCHVRRTYPALMHGSLTWLKTDAPDNVLAFIREHGKQTLLCIINATNRPQSLSLTLPKAFTDLSWEPILDPPASMTTKNTSLFVEMESFGAYSFSIR